MHTYILAYSILAYAYPRTLSFCLSATCTWNYHVSDTV